MIQRLRYLLAYRYGTCGCGRPLMRWCAVCAVCYEARLDEAKRILGDDAFYRELGIIRKLNE